MGGNVLLLGHMSEGECPEGKMSYSPWPRVYANDAGRCRSAASPGRPHASTVARLSRRSVERDA